ncbi:hypothetical protein Ccrd_017922 [Cynara cardunculus var. scolymus]|uniref:Aminoacyl-tRNA synthetase class II (D/K/N) domain-containing protein n=1 Tax=Cynara cardunculus var. scolymus TaxID=59895 RepID=A0A118K240_CYNCS|nr:hypothetical protein Ccrd_017922 [Cynara cardunculus var. scolymus]
MPVVLSKYSKRVLLKTILDRADGGLGLVEQRVVVGGWVKSSREMRKNPPPPPTTTQPPVGGGGGDAKEDAGGKDVKCVEIMVDSSIAPPSLLMPTGTCILAEGILQKSSLQGKRIMELKAEKLLHIGIASHAFFQNQGFVHVEVPILTAMDTDGFSEKFQVSTSSVSAKEPKREEPVSMDDTANVSLETIKLSIVEKSKKVEELKRSDSNKEALAAAVHDLQKTNALAAELEARSKSKSKPKPKSKSKSKSSEFFSNEAFLASSGTLHLESCASALGNVYAFGPRFQADKSESKKSLAESWMIETEIAFSELEVVDKTFETKIRWGVALTEEHESYLVNEFYKKPVIIYDHPKELKPFHVRLNDDGKTVAAFDVIVPKVLNERSFLVWNFRDFRICCRINELGLQKEQYEWYLDLRKQGTVKHSGFSVTFDVMVLFATGLNDIQDAVPFPRNHGKLHN